MKFTSLLPSMLAIFGLLSIVGAFLLLRDPPGGDSSVAFPVAQLREHEQRLAQQQQQLLAMQQQLLAMQQKLLEALQQQANQPQQQQQDAAAAATGAAAAEVEKHSSASARYAAVPGALVPVDAACVNAVSATHPSLTPTKNFSVVRLPAGMRMACYWDDLVCNSIRKRHVFGAAVHLLISGALAALRREVRAAADILATRLGLPGLPAHALHASDVTVLDVGAHVGSVGFDMWHQGYTTRFVEGLHKNVWLIHYSMCVNRRAATGQRNPRTMALTFAALGADAGECAIISGTNNEGDGLFICEPKRVALARQFVKLNRSVWVPDPRYRVRGFAPVRTLDTIVFGFSGSVDSAPLSGGWDHANHAAVVHFHDAYAAASAPADGSGNDGGAPLTAAASGRIDDQMSTTALLRFLRHRQYVMKLDIEGSEIKAWTGGSRWLASPEIRPKVIISEMFMNLNWTHYGSLMYNAGYTGFLIDLKLRPVPSLAALAAVKAELAASAVTVRMIDMVWLQRPHVHLLEAMRRAVGW